MTLSLVMQKTMEAALFEIGEDLALLAGNEWNDAWVGMFGDVFAAPACSALSALPNRIGPAQGLWEGRRLPANLLSAISRGTMIHA